MLESLNNYKIQDVYNTPTQPDKVELTAQFIGQDFALKVSSDIDVLYKLVSELKSL